MVEKEKHTDVLTTEELQQKILAKFSWLENAYHKILIGEKVFDSNFVEEVEIQMSA